MRVVELGFLAPNRVCDVFRAASVRAARVCVCTMHPYYASVLRMRWGALAYVLTYALTSVRM